MKHKTLITPLNCAFGLGIGTLMKMETSEYDAVTDRGIFSKSPDISWFKMKAISATPYLEPTLYGLKPGDIIEVEFKAMVLSGSNVKITVPFLKIQPDYLAPTFGSVDTDVLTSYFKKYKLRYMIPANFDGIGMILNVRQNLAPSEVILKDLEITIETSNPTFSMADNIIDFRSRADYMKCIDFYSGTNLNTTYHGLKTLYDTGKVTFPDNETLQFSTAGFTEFKGLMSMFNGHKYRPTFGVYAEYIAPNSITATTKNVKDDGTFVNEGTAALPASATLRKTMVYFLGSTQPSRKTFIDLGAITAVQDLTLKNVRFSMPQFDDSVKRRPNQLEELYTNLSAKLR